jgi:hypothetical protein
MSRSDLDRLKDARRFARIDPLVAELDKLIALVERIDT